MSAFIELEIKNLLQENSDVQSIAKKLISTLESQPDLYTDENIKGLSQFLLNAGLPSLLLNFCLDRIDNDGFILPWAYFLEALGGATKIPLETKLIDALNTGIHEQEQSAEAGRAQKLSAQIPDLNNWRLDRKFKIHKNFVQNKSNMLDELLTLRTQRLYEQESILLEKLQKLYPRDRDIQKEYREYKERYALEILQRRGEGRRSVIKKDTVNPLLESALTALKEDLQKKAFDDPSLAFDFAILSFMLEDYPTTLNLLELADETASAIWFRLEVLLQSKRYIDLLSEIAKVEILYAHDAETFFATAYLRAQALWGLGQKYKAIDVLEGILASRPQYRAAGALLRIWSTT